MARLTTLEHPKRSEIWISDLRLSMGREIGKKRPSLVVSSGSINQASPLVIVIPISLQILAITSPEKILLPAAKTGLSKASVLIIHQIRAIDKSRLIKKIGLLSKDKMIEVEDALKLVLGLEELA